MRHLFVILAFAITSLAAPVAVGQSAKIKREWSHIDWSSALVPPDEIRDGGVGRDGIPPVYAPTFGTVESEDLPGREPVLSLDVDGDARAYPLRYLTAHEIVNDTVSGMPVVVTYCPLCNTGMAFERRASGVSLRFGVSGLLRHSSLIMWDRRTGSLWQQFEGRAIAGKFAGTELVRVPVRMEAMSEFARRHPGGKVLAPPDPDHRYGTNPYVSYDARSGRPFLYKGDLPKGIPAMERVVVVDGEAWRLRDIVEAGELRHGDLVFRHSHDMASALDKRRMAAGRDVAGVVAQRRDPDTGSWVDIPHEVTFAFVFHAFHPDGAWHFDRS